MEFTRFAMLLLVITFFIEYYICEAKTRLAGRPCALLMCIPAASAMIFLNSAVSVCELQP